MTARRFFGTLLVGAALIVSGLVVYVNVTDPRPIVDSHESASYAE